jgi:ATP-dependent Clp protease adapter protein ClpS
MGPRLVSVFFGAVFVLALCTWSKTSVRGSTDRFFLLPMAGDLAWRPATHPARSISPIAQMAPAPARTRPGIARPKPRPGIAKPKPKPKPREAPQRQKKAVKRTQRADPIFEEPPPYRLVLLGDEEYEEEHVIVSMRAIVPDLKGDARRASEIFKLAQNNGREQIVIVPQDMAEQYAEQLTRCVPIIYAVAEKAE